MLLSANIKAFWYTKLLVFVQAINLLRPNESQNFLDPRINKT